MKHSYTLVLFWIFSFSGISDGIAGSGNPLNGLREQPKTAEANLPQSEPGIELNKGQWPEQVLFKMDVTQGSRLFLESDRFTYVLHNQSQVDAVHENAHNNNVFNEKTPIDVHAFQMRFVGANPLHVSGENKRSYYYNYFLGNNAEHWATEVPVHDAVVYENLYQDINLRAYGKEGAFKYDYLLKAGADPSQIKLIYTGVRSVQLRDGKLVIATSVGELVESIPLCYQLIDGRKMDLPCEYKMYGDKSIGFYFPLGYDPSFPLVIDPVLMASTYSGAANNTYGHCSTYDGAGNIYTGGRSFGTGYPVSLGAYQVPFGGVVDIAISKLNPTGSALIYATYLGGSSSDYPHSLFVDSNNELYIFGSSTSNNFPVTSGAFDNTANGLSDMVVSKLNTTGTGLLASTYIGGSADDGVNNGASFNYADNFRGEIIVTSTGDVFVTSASNSSNFPATGAAYDNTQNGLQDAVLVKLNANLSTLVWATFIGGTDNDAGCSLRVASNGEIYMVGVTKSSNFPTAGNGLNNSYMGGQADGFVTRFNANGSTLLSSSFIGTNLMDITYFVDLDYLNDVYIYGVSAGSMPISAGVFNNVGSQNYVMKLNSALNTILYSTVIGGGTHSSFAPSALMVDFCQNVYICGWGTTLNYPFTANATQTNNPGSCFSLMVLSQGATSLLYGSFFGSGGEHVDGGTSRFDKNGVVYQAVCACSPNFPTMTSAYSPTKLSSGCDIVVFKIDFQIGCNALSAARKICYGQSTTVNIPNINQLSNPVFSCQPGGQSNTTGNFTFSPTSSTNYTMFITGTNGFNTVVTNTGIVSVTVVPQPFVSPSFTQATCTNAANAFDLGLSFLPSSITPTYSIFWSPVPNGIVTNTQYAASGAIAPGGYQATITAVGGCTATSMFTMNPFPTAVNYSISGPFVITCDNPTLNLTITPPIYNYFWSGLTATFTGASASFTAGNTGTWVVTGSDVNGGCVTTQSFVISVNNAPVTSTLVPLSQNINCSITAVTNVSATASPSVNMTHLWLSPLGGTLASSGASSQYPPGGPGTYTHVAINTSNGCTFTQTFVVNSTSGFPTFNVQSPQNFTLGCSTKSIITINIVNGQATPQGGAVSYTLLSPNSSVVYTTTGQSTFTQVTLPGTYTVITKDNTTACETKIPISVLQNTFAPDLQVQTTGTIITCDRPSVVLQGSSATPNVSYNWSYNGQVSNLASDTIRSNFTPVTTATLVDNYTLTITDNNNLCKSKIVVPVLQNTARPKVIFSGAAPISCKVGTLTLTNQSTSNVPAIFNPTAPVVGYLWQGPSPEDPLQLKTTYVGSTPGVYTLTGKDLNNGCIGTFTALVADDRDFPIVSAPEGGAFIFDCGAPGATIFPVVSGSTNNLQYVWQPRSDVAFSSLTTATTIVNKTGHFDIVVTNTLNGCLGSGFIEVVAGTLTADFVADPDTGFAPMTVLFSNLSASSSTLNGKNNIQTAWSFGNGKQQAFVSASFSPSTVYERPGTYDVKLFVGKGQCQAEMMRRVFVQIPSSLEVPNVFTPNNDGVNDVYFLHAAALTEVYVSITNRWGETVYELNSGSGNISWNGQNQKGVEVAEGVYMYILKATGLDGQSFEQNGTITLIR